MYGMINKAMREMVEKDFGQDTWALILQESGVSADSFLSLRRCSDDDTYALVAAASQVLKQPSELVLEAFGVHWIVHTTPENYSKILDLTGRDIMSFLSNVNAMHDRIASTFVHYQPPWFELEQISDSEALLHYHSERQGLSGFVKGLLRGLGVRFKTSLVFENIRFLDVPKGEHTIFHIRCESAT